MYYKKRIDHELGEKYEVIKITEGKNSRQHITIKYNYNKMNYVTIVLNQFYPFERPLSITNDTDTWCHERYSTIKNIPYISDYDSYIIKDCCLHCKYNYQDAWSPMNTINTTIKNYIDFDIFISNIIKTEYVFRNNPILPERLKLVVFSYLK
jgi:hypothetical protein